MPGNPPANPYMNYPPNKLRAMELREEDPDERKKMLSALKQWERIFTYPGYPWRERCSKKVVAKFWKLSEQTGPMGTVDLSIFGQEKL